MVNKALLSLAAVVLFAVFGTGVFVGMQVGGPGVVGPGATEAGPQTATPAGTDSPATAAAAAEPTPTPTPAPSEDSDDEQPADRERVPPREFDARNISAAIVADINDAREAEGLDRLSTTGTTSENIREMASSHSDAMADAGLRRHTIDGVSSPDRYRQYDLYDSCRFQVESYIEDARNNALEVVGRTYAGQEYSEGGTERFNENNTAVAGALTEDWLSTQRYRERLTYANAERMGVGVTVTSTGTVYATVNVC